MLVTEQERIAAIQKRREELSAKEVSIASPPHPKTEFFHWKSLPRAKFRTLAAAVRVQGDRIEAD